MPTFEPYSEDEIFGNERKASQLTFLTPKDILMIDEALSKIGSFGELHLIVDKGRLRFLVVQKSYDCNKRPFEP